jgi:hypothetical protein
MSKSKKRAKGPRPGFVRITLDYPHEPNGDGPWLRFHPDLGHSVSGPDGEPALGRCVSIKWNKADQS